jgi:hypothetical protein
LGGKKHEFSPFTAADRQLNFCQPVAAAIRLFFFIFIEEQECRHSEPESESDRQSGGFTDR